VWVGKRIVDKAGTLVAEGQRVMLNVEEAKFVSRAGYKLDAAIQHFGIDVRDKYCLDAGIGTGGFTDCLLQRGALKVYGVDVGYGDVDYSLRVHPRVCLLERTNLRFLDPTLIDHAIDLVTLDLSFISVLKVIPVVAELMDSEGEMVVLIKPQFEAEREDVKEGGIVDDPDVHQAVIEKIKLGIEEEGFDCGGVIECPLRGKDSENIEYLAHFRCVKN